MVKNYTVMKPIKKLTGYGITKKLPSYGSSQIITGYESN